MITKKEIVELKLYLINTLHSKRLREQAIDQQYVDDAFGIDYLPEGTTQLKTGKAYRMVSAPAEHIITHNPVVYREQIGKASEQAKRVGIEVNRWAKIMSRQNPNPYKEHVRKNLGKGEAWIYVLHNNDYKSDDINDLPVSFLIPDPTIVFADVASGEVNGVPGRVIISFSRIASLVKRDYPDFQWLKKGRRKWDTSIPMLMYWDKDSRYIEADEEALYTEADMADSEGIQANVYGFVPLVHCYSGFGEGSADGDPSTLAVSRIRKCRDLIGEYTAIKSVVNSFIFKYASPPVDLVYDPAIGTPTGDIGENYDRSPHAFNVMGLPAGATITKGVDKLPEQELFQYLATIENQIDEEDPLGQIGQQIGTSGRQQLDAKAGALARFETVVENTAVSFSTAFGLALRMIEKIPTIKPDTLGENDIGKNYNVTIELKAEDPVASQIKSADGDRKQTQGIIDHETNLIEYQGFTQEQADQITSKLLVDNVIMNDPVIRRLMAIQVAREIGMEQQYTDLEKQLAQMEKQTLKSAPETGKYGGEPRMGNIKTQTGAEMPDMSLTQRPERMSAMQ